MYTRISGPFTQPRVYGGYAPGNCTLFIPSRRRTLDSCILRLANANSLSYSLLEKSIAHAWKTWKVRTEDRDAFESLGYIVQHELVCKVCGGCAHVPVLPRSLEVGSGEEGDHPQHGDM